MTPLTLTIEGMSCDHCVRRVQKALSALPGVEVADVRVGQADVRVDTAQVDRAQLASALDDAGYTLTNIAAH